ncbi:MAG: S-adenosylmethionine:tRNA ribosyltransferase-isomerase [Bacteroidales bacterium]|nr:S-adenosylmethionine:tRNA ribosyltransferase-isomerase [Bacteroidales bacterium]
MDKHILNINDFDYELPEERIAKYPLAQRDNSKLLVYRDAKTSQKVFHELPTVLPGNSLLVFNNTKVIHARLPFQKETGARIEIFCLNPVEPVDYQQMMVAKNTCTWKCLVGNQKKWKDGALKKVVEIGGHTTTILAEKISKEENHAIIRFSWDTDIEFFRILLEIGNIPIPPYLNRNSEEIDKNRYQTIFAQMNGSVAAPTASLHFTDSVLNELAKKNCATVGVTLHVGAGTFQPVKTSVDEHEMHSEFISISKDTVEKLCNHEDDIIATGTTSLRTLESLYWFGNQVRLQQTSDEIEQWVWKQDDLGLSRHESLKETLQYLEINDLNEVQLHTSIMITPGYSPRMADILITNFHQPKSTLLLLVSAFIGDNWKDVYKYAMENDFRFLSYGDSSVLFRD